MSWDAKLQINALFLQKSSCSIFFPLFSHAMTPSPTSHSVAAARLALLARAVTSSTMTSQPHPVATTPELLEQILLNLDMHTLLVSAQRVSKAWHSLITSSKPLQRHLYFEPITAKTPQEITTTRTRNPLLEKTFKPFFPPPGTSFEGGQRYYLQGNSFAAQSGFSFMDEDPSPKPADAAVPSYTGKHSIPAVRAAAQTRKAEKEAAEARAKEVAARRRKAFLRKGASWRRMLIQQPAATKIGWIENRGQTEQSFYQGTIVARPAGRSMQTLYNVWHGASSPKSSTTDDGGVIRMDLLYDAVYQYSGGTRAAFSIYWRDPAKDPAPPAYMGHGSGSSILRDFSDDIGVVVNMSAGGMDKRNMPEVLTKADVRDRSHMPDEFEVREVKLELIFAQDWFG
jgi:hypothetical protein